MFTTTKTATRWPHVPAACAALVLLGAASANAQTAAGGINVPHDPDSPAPVKSRAHGPNSTTLLNVANGEPGYAESVLGATASGIPIRAYYFAGASNERALVIAGVHGSEKSGVEVARILCDLLSTGPRPYYSVVIVPVLFPDNYAMGLREGSVPTNRNFPRPGKSLATARAGGSGAGEGPLDELGRVILPENMMLMELIERFRPSRIASVHATQRPNAAGIFADAHSVSAAALAVAAGSGRPGFLSAGLLYAAAEAWTKRDRELALMMAREVEARGAGVAGNKLSTIPTAKWSGSCPAGASLGEWGPHDITEGRPTDRPSITVITVEVAGNADSSEVPLGRRAARRAELTAHAAVLRDIFLGAWSSQLDARSRAASR